MCCVVGGWVGVGVGVTETKTKTDRQRQRDRAHTLRIVSTDTILRFINNFIIINYYQHYSRALRWPIQLPSLRKWISSTICELLKLCKYVLRLRCVDSCEAVAACLRFGRLVFHPDRLKPAQPVRLTGG